MSESAQRLGLDVEVEVARAIHRVVRGMHDGECPKCHRLHQSGDMRDQECGTLADLVCPTCGFTITAAEQERAIELFAPTMRRNLELFERWRAALLPHPPPADEVIDA